MKNKQQSRRYYLHSLINKSFRYDSEKHTVSIPYDAVIEPKVQKALT